MFLYLLFFIAMMTALITWLLNGRKVAKSEKKSKQVAKNKPSPPLEALQFRAWLKTTDKIDPSLQTWLLTLSKEELNTLSQQVAIYCKTLGMELDWLLQASHQLHMNQSLQDTMHEVVIAYLTSHHKAAQVKDEIQIFKTYQQFHKNPASNPDLVRKLFAKLVDNGLVTASLSDLLDDEQQKRQDYMISTIRQTAKSNPVEFNNALNAVQLL